MKLKKWKGPVKSIILGILVVIMIISFTSCSKKIPFSTSSVVPAAKGYVKVKSDKNKNFVIKLKVTDLAEVERLGTSKLTYVAWIETDQGDMKNLGQLNSSTSFLSKRHRASLKTISSFTPIKIFITSEYDINVEFPGNQVVLTTEKFTVK
jgi:hypothetical protein